MGKRRRLLGEYRFPGYRPNEEIRGVFGDPKARIIRLERAPKKRFVGSEICPVGMPGYIWRWRYGGFIAGSVGP
jgi:hypothetical protein